MLKRMTATGHFSSNNAGAEHGACDLQVEFGAHQVILMRSTSSYDTLPPLLKESNALTMTVPQSKASPCP